MNSEKSIREGFQKILFTLTLNIKQNFSGESDKGMECSQKMPNLLKMYKI